MPVQIPLTRGYVALVDEADAKRVSAHKWCVCIHKHGQYAQMRQDYKIVYLHRFILGFGSGDPRIDHRDHDGLNNQRSNLRPATQGLNLANQRHRKKRFNKHGFRGVKQDGERYRGEIRVNGKCRYSAYCATPEEAARARDELALAYWGEFAVLNFPVSP